MHAPDVGSLPAAACCAHPPCNAVLRRLSLGMSRTHPCCMCWAPPPERTGLKRFTHSPAVRRRHRSPPLAAARQQAWRCSKSALQRRGPGSPVTHVLRHFNALGVRTEDLARWKAQCGQHCRSAPPAAATPWRGCGLPWRRRRLSGRSDLFVRTSGTRLERPSIHRPSLRFAN